MNCPKCNHPISHHMGHPGWGGCVELDGEKFCHCKLTAVQALLAAQRHAAAGELWKLSRKWWKACEVEDFVEGTVYGARALGLQSVIRILGIQRPRGSLKE